MSQPTEPRRLGTLLTDVGPEDQRWLTTLRAGGREVTIEAIGASADNSCADLAFTYRYRFASGKFARVTREVGNANECQRIG